MMAVVRLGGHQYLISEGDTLVTGKLPNLDSDKSFTSRDVLLLFSGDQLQLGTPILTGGMIEMEVLGQGKGDKVDIGKFKSKVRYRKRQGYRAQETTLKVKKIEKK